ncbi:excinuclease ABC subunit UvrA [Oscillospiraceae bacterium PP1C4]
MKSKAMIIHPIGKYSDNTILLQKPYADGLLHLDLFSHAIIIFSSADGSLSCCVIKISFIDMKEGKVEIKGDTPLVNDACIYDIKPYFPCEDRVKNSTSPDADVRIFSHIENNSLAAIGTIQRQDGEYLLRVQDTGCLPPLKNCSHIRIFWWFDRFDAATYRKTTQCNPPYENAPRTGVFASRSPVRPNPIAITTARILNISGDTIKVTGLDCFPGTMLIGILPYNPKRDCIDQVMVPRWLDHWPQWVDDSEDKNTSKVEIKPSALELIGKTPTATKNTVNHIFNSNTSAPPRDQNAIIIKGARQNNLKGIDVQIPYHKITAITGVSGSGKSSLAFDTIYAECRRRFIDSMGGMEKVIKKPDLDSIDGIIPAVAVSQKSVGKNPRSTVGTFTDMYDYLRTMFASVGVRHCPDCGEAIVPMTADAITALLEQFDNVKITTYKGETVSDTDLFKTVKKALDIGKGAFFASIEKKEPILFQTTQMCYHCNKLMFELTPATFNFNDPESMCPVCNGYGVKMDVDKDLIISNPSISLLDGASLWWGKLRSFRNNPNANWMKGELLALADDMQVDLELPWCELPEQFRYQAIYGSGERKVTLGYHNKQNGRSGNITRPVEGAYNCIKRLYTENGSGNITANFMHQSLCSRCNGERLAREGRMVTIGDTRFPQIVSMSLSELKEWCERLPSVLSEPELKTAASLIQKLHSCLCRCIELGLGYLSLDRSLPTLSGGERQRLKLISLLESDISGVLYVLDEPTAGLHPKDYQSLINAINLLKDHGNTVVLVEHNADMIKIADHILDVGPGAGENGGCLIAQGSLSSVMQNMASETGGYLSGKDKIGVAKHTDIAKSNWIKLSGIRHNNLKNIEITFPTGAITCVCGVSGSGKSSLVNGVIYPAIQNKLAGTRTDMYCDSIEGIENFDKIILADQSPIGRTPRSVPATYMDIMDEVRDLFAATAEASAQGFTASHFSFNAKQGQCENCHGDGETSPAFMDDIWITCPVCKGQRYKSFILSIKYKEKSISDVLSMSVAQAYEFFADNYKLSKMLSTLKDVGLGYLKLGQNSATLSGGEAQRLKLARELSAKQTGKTLYLLDEPTTGLHFSDIQNLLLLVGKLTDTGNTIVMIEHNMDVIKNADWIIDLGPDGGVSGGYVVAQGTPRDVAAVHASYTGRYLAER